MSGGEQRRSERVIPFVSDDEVVVIQQAGKPNLLSKMMDLSDVGTLVYMLTDEVPDGSVTLSIHHQKNVVEAPATVVRKNGRLIAFDFVNPPPEVLHEIQSKLIRMEVEWMRLSRMG